MDAEGVSVWYGNGDVYGSQERGRIVAYFGMGRNEGKIVWIRDFGIWIQ
jgi:hypothetical protein